MFRLRNAIAILWWDLRRMVFSTWANAIVGSVFVPRLLRPYLLRLARLDVGRAHIASNVTFLDGNVRMGSGVAVNVGTVFEGRGGITLGSGVVLGPGVMLGTSTHDIGTAEQRMGPPRVAPIVVGDGTWICTRAVILPGVTIGPGCVIAAGAVVNADCEPNGVYAGVPARRVRDLP